VIALLLFAGLITAESKPGDHFKAQDKDWQEFRAAFPFHMQVLALSAPHDDGASTLIISEPPPHATYEALIATDPAHLSDSLVCQHAIGYDGWVKDVVVRLPAMTNTEWTNLLGRLSKYLYSTDYKAYALSLPIDLKQLYIKQPLDVRVPTVSLEQWFHKLKYLDRSGASCYLAGAAPGLYLSAKPGLLVWVIPKTGLEQRQEEARKFALDSDLILGAVEQVDSVAIFARERITPVTIMPPLRVETILTLAGASRASLAQSYERTAFGAGPWADTWDWAPIYLSSELINTEYGSLLNLADQELKGFSQCGTVEYHNFPYAQPSRFPFDGALSKILNTDSLLFNWNTIGFGLATDTGTPVAHSIYAPTRTGALPVIYRPEDETSPSAIVSSCEERAYSYFATLNDPILARVVQYGTLFQIFNVYHVAAAQSLHQPWDQSAALRANAADVLKALREATAKDIEDAAGTFTKTIKQRISNTEPSEPLPFTKEEIVDALTELRSDYKDYYSDRGHHGETEVSKILGLTGDTDEMPLKELQEDDSFDDFLMAEEVRQTPAVCFLSDIPTMQKRFSGSLPDNTGRWIRTPTVVFSRCLGNGPIMVGGHNIDPSVTRITRRTSQKPGTATFGLDGEVICNPDDAPVVELQASLIARLADDEERKTAIELALRNSPHPLQAPLLDILGRANEIASLERGFCAPEHLPLPAGAADRPPKPPALLSAPPPLGPALGNSPDFAMNNGEQETIRISKAGQIAFIQRVRSKRNPAESSEAWNQRDLVYGICAALEEGGRTVDKEPLRIEFDESYTAKEAERVIKTLSLHAARARSNRLVVSFRNSKPGFAERLAQPIKEAKVEHVGTQEDTRSGTSGAQVTGEVSVGEDADTIRISFDVFLAAAKRTTVDTAEHSIQNALGRAIKNSIAIANLPPEIYEGLVRDIEAVRANSSGAFSVGDLGDVYITIFDRGGQFMGLVAVVEKRQ
jgi:hypothetical protein